MYREIAPENEREMTENAIPVETPATSAEIAPKVELLEKMIQFATAATKRDT